MLQKDVSVGRVESVVEVVDRNYGPTGVINLLESNNDCHVPFDGGLPKMYAEKA